MTDSLRSTMLKSIRRVLPSTLAPKNNVTLWTILNALCCGFSALLLVTIAFGVDESKIKALAKETYLWYNMVTSIVWSLETALKYAYEEGHVLEACLAFYFLLDSAVVLADYHWRREHITAMIVDCLINFCAYLYLLISNRNQAHSEYHEINMPSQSISD